MAQSTHKSYFTSEELQTLQRAFGMACAALDVAADDRAGRDRLGALVFEVAQAGTGDEAVLKAEAVRRFRDPGRDPGQDPGMTRSGAEAGLAFGVVVPGEHSRLAPRPDR